MNAIVIELTKYWRRKNNRPCATRFAVRSTVYDEFNCSNPQWIKMQRAERQRMVETITNDIIHNINQ